MNTSKVHFQQSEVIYIYTLKPSYFYSDQWYDTDVMLWQCYAEVGSNELHLLRYIYLSKFFG